MSYTSVHSYRHRRWPRVLAIIGIVVLVLIAAAVAVALWKAPHFDAISPAPGAFIKTTTPTISARVGGLGGVRDITVVLDGTDVSASASRSGDTISVAAKGLADGAHTVTIGGASSNPLRRHVSTTWSFTVDTVAPPLTVDGIGGASDGIKLSGASEPGAIVSSATTNASGTTTASADGRYTLKLRLRKGAWHVTVKATDRAGNAATSAVVVYVSATPFMLALTDPRVVGAMAVVKTASPTIAFIAAGADVTPRLQASLDGKSLAVSTDSPQGTVKLSGLAEGRHELAIAALAGNGQRISTGCTFTVDSTEKFGAATLIAGALGADVKELQRRLAKAGVYKGPGDGVFGDSTFHAVQAFEKKMGMAADGIVGVQVIGALSGHIVIDLSQLRLYFYKGTRLVATYPIAAGQPAYPTPTGHYYVVEMVKNPTWTPPNSPWAKGAVPIPPGETNPLGPRWIGTSAPGIGIHGTNDPSSIGLHVSHGCIRMYVPDVEKLFEMVTVGMPVIIQP
jgi:lipoprotein-anchoring transpeptidase ErfK/SrfK